MVKWLQYLRVGVYLTVLAGVCVWSVTGDPDPPQHPSLNMTLASNVRYK